MSMSDLHDALVNVITCVLDSHLEDRVSDIVSDLLKKEAEAAVESAAEEWDFSEQVRDAIEEGIREIDLPCKVEEYIPDVEKRVDDYLDDHVDWPAQVYEAFRCWRSLPADVTDGLRWFIAERVEEETRALRDELAILHAERTEALAYKRGWFRGLLRLPKLAAQGLLKLLAD